MLEAAQKKEINTVVREATPLDISELLRLGWNAFKETELFSAGIELDINAMSEILLNIIKSEGAVGKIFVAEHSFKPRKLVGRIMAIKAPLIFNPSVTTSVVLGVAVDKKIRGSGIGRQLISAVMDWAKENNIDVVAIHHRLSNGKKVEAMYQDLGLRPLETVYYNLI